MSNQIWFCDYLKRATVIYFIFVICLGQFHEETKYYKICLTAIEERPVLYGVSIIAIPNCVSVHEMSASFHTQRS